MTAAIEASSEAINGSSETMVVTGERRLLDVQDLSSNMVSLK